MNEAGRTMDAGALFMGVLFALIWSAAFTAGHIVVEHVPPFHALGLRFAVAGALGLAIGRAMGQDLRLTRGQWRAIVVFGLCQNVVYLGTNFVAMQTVQASLAAIVASTMPLLVALFGWAVRGERLAPLGMAGLVAGLAGVALIMAARLSGGVDMAGLGALVIGVLALTVATLAVRGAAGANMLMVVSLQMLVGAVVLLPVAVASEPWRMGGGFPVLAAGVFMVVGASLFATWLWFRLVLRVGPVKAATFHFLNPAFGVGVAALLLGERVGRWDVIGVAIIAAGILAVQVSRKPGATACAPQDTTA